jgi:chitodextrinase
LTWTKPTDSDLLGIVVYRIAGTTPPTPTTAGVRTVMSTRDPKVVPDEVTDTGLTPDTEYAYAVYAVDKAGNLSTPATVNATTKAAPPA